MKIVAFEPEVLLLLGDGSERRRGQHATAGGWIARIRPAAVTRTVTPPRRHGERRAPDRTQHGIVVENGRRRAVARDGVMGIGEIMTFHNAPDQIVAAINVDFDNRLSAGDVERMIDEMEREVQRQFPSVTRIYVRPHEDAGLKFGTRRGIN